MHHGSSDKKDNAFQSSGRTRNLCSKMGLRAKDTLFSPHEGEPREFQAVRRGRRPWSLGPGNKQASPRPNKSCQRLGRIQHSYRGEMVCPLRSLVRDYRRTQGLVTSPHRSHGPDMSFKCKPSQKPNKQFWRYASFLAFIATFLLVPSTTSWASALHRACYMAYVMTYLDTSYRDGSRAWPWFQRLPVWRLYCRYIKVLERFM